MVMVFLSRFQKGLENGAEVSFDRGETVTFRGKSGKEYQVVIDSDLMRHEEAPGDKTGYEAIFDDGRFFISRTQIVDWEGKGLLPE